MESRINKKKTTTLPHYNKYLDALETHKKQMEFDIK